MGCGESHKEIHPPMISATNIGYVYVLYGHCAIQCINILIT